MANEYSHIPNNHLADALISKIKGVANSKSYAQVTSASWSVSEDESSESSEGPTPTPEPGDNYGFEIESATAILSQGETTVTVRVTSDDYPVTKLVVFKDGTQYGEQSGEGTTRVVEIAFDSGANISVGDTLTYEFTRTDGSYDTYSGSVVVTVE